METELLIACSRVDVKEETRSKIKELASGSLDWEKLIAMAVEHKVLPLVFSSLDRICPDCLSQKNMVRLESVCFDNAVNNMRLSGVLGNILSLFRDNGITAVPFKGPVLEEKVYGNTGLRSYVDLDIFIAKKDVARCLDLLLENGFLPEKDNRLSPAQVQSYIDHEYNFTLENSDKSVVVDLQWELSGRYTAKPIYIEHFQGRLVRDRLNGKDILTFPDEEMLFYLCLHGCRHGWRNLGLVSCVSEMVAHCTHLDWDHLIRFAARFGSKSMLFLGLALSREIMGVCIPENIEAEIQSSRVVQVSVERVLSGLFEDHSGYESTEERFDLFPMKILDRPSDRGRYLLRMMYNPTKEDWKCFSFMPGSCSFLLYGLRPCRLVCEYIKRRFLLTEPI